MDQFRALRRGGGGCDSALRNSHWQAISHPHFTIDCGYYGCARLLLLAPSLTEWYKGCTLLLLRERWGGGNEGAVSLLPSDS